MPEAVTSLPCNRRLHISYSKARYPSYIIIFRQASQILAPVVEYYYSTELLEYLSFQLAIFTGLHNNSTNAKMEHQLIVGHLLRLCRLLNGSIPPRCLCNSESTSRIMQLPIIGDITSRPGLSLCLRSIFPASMECANATVPEGIRVSYYKTSRLFSVSSGF
ncbi:hypothetical protein OE88DRAFT_322441 [Heliocybe sulcata]|uniref:Uncharacterized protein n=1 Tax=Heliocybe sulcata TaxID=5364 RepID=A0A5C3MX71_9AGAM|nr:hypothetical protein OE88DRAFT_322441 [Heliocybe sulcata]